MLLIPGLCGESVFLSVDHFHRPEETLHAESLRREAGGKGYNQAVAARRAGAEVFFLGAVGRYKPQLVGFNSRASDLKILVLRGSAVKFLAVDPAGVIYDDRVAFLDFAFFDGLRRRRFREPLIDLRLDILVRYLHLGKRSFDAFVLAYLDDLVIVHLGIGIQLVIDNDSCACQNDRRNNCGHDPCAFFYLLVPRDLHFFNYFSLL